MLRDKRATHNIRHEDRCFFPFKRFYALSVVPLGFGIERSAGRVRITRPKRNGDRLNWCHLNRVFQLFRTQILRGLVSDQWVDDVAFLRAQDQTLVVSIRGQH